MWIDTHAHLDAAEFDPDRSAIRQAARAAGVGHCVIPAVERANWSAVRELAHVQGDSYCLGIHPLYVPQAQESDLAALDAELSQHREDPRLVAVGEIGLDFFVPALCEPSMRERQEFFYAAQLRLARARGLPVVLHCGAAPTACSNTCGRWGRAVTAGAGLPTRSTAARHRLWLLSDWVSSWVLVAR